MFQPSVNAISLFVEEQFPNFYETDGPNFIVFVQKYFEWLEQEGNPVWFIRNVRNFIDIDKTIDDYIVHFKQKYLKDIQFQTFSNKVLFIKNALDFYRAKGSTRAIDLFFQLIYGEEADVFLPKTDILRVSDGTWTKPLYIEVSDSPLNNLFINQQIQGVRSGATAFVERFVKKKIGAKTINVFFISNLVGNFQTNELLLCLAAPLSKQSPTMIGSLSELEIVEGGFDFNVGDQVNIINKDNQIDGQALVVSTIDITGIVQFTLLDGGFGYNNATSFSIISDKVIGLSNVQVTSNTINLPFLYFEQFVEPLANIQFANLASGTFNVGDSLVSQNSTSVNVGFGVVLSTNITGNTGNLFISQLSGNVGLGTKLLDATTSATANIVSYSDKTVSANVMGVSSNATLYVTNSFGTWANGDSVTQGSSFGFIDRAVPVGSNTVLFITNIHGTFFTNNQVSSPEANGTVFSMDTSIGIIGASGVFSNLESNFVFGANSETTATIKTISTGGGAGFHIGLVDNKETFTIAVDLINGLNVVGVPFLDIQLDGANSGMGINAYGFTRLTTANLSSFLIQTFGGSETSGNIGTIETITGINPGAGYNANPFVLLYDPFVASRELADYLITINASNGNFQIGEIIEQNAVVSNSVTLVVDNAVATIENFSVANGGGGYTNGDHITAVSSGTNAVANVTTYANGTIKYLIVTNYGAGFVPSSIHTVLYSNSTGGSTTGSGANVSAIASTFLLGDVVYESNGTANIATGIVQFKSLTNGNGTLQVNTVSGTFTTAFELGAFSSNTQANIVSVNSLSYSTTAKGIIKVGSNTSFMYVRRLSVGSSFVPNDAITGLSTGVVANVVSVGADPSSNVVGWDATVQANVIAANGSVSNLQVLDSGFGYTNGDIVTFESLDGVNSGLAKALVFQQGQGAGFYTSSRGFLDDDKKIQDDFYWQEFSYEVRTNIPLKTYSDIFKKVLHLAGTQLFGAVYLTSNTDISIQASDSPLNDVYIFTLGQPINPLQLVMFTVGGFNANAANGTGGIFRTADFSNIDSFVDVTPSGFLSSGDFPDAYADIMAANDESKQVVVAGSRIDFSTDGGITFQPTNIGSGQFAMTNNPAYINQRIAFSPNTVCVSGYDPNTDDPLIAWANRSDLSTFNIVNLANVAVPPSFTVDSGGDAGCLAYKDGIFAVLPEFWGTIVLTSNDEGVTWTTTFKASVANFYIGLISGNGIFLSLGYKIDNQTATQATHGSDGGGQFITFTSPIDHLPLDNVAVQDLSSFNSTSFILAGSTTSKIYVANNTGFANGDSIQIVNTKAVSLTSSNGSSWTETILGALYVAAPELPNSRNFPDSIQFVEEIGKWIALPDSRFTTFSVVDPTTPWAASSNDDPAQNDGLHYAKIGNEYFFVSEDDGSVWKVSDPSLPFSSWVMVKTGDGSQSLGDTFGNSDGIISIGPEQLNNSGYLSTDGGITWAALTGPIASWLADGRYVGLSRAFLL